MELFRQLDRQHRKVSGEIDLLADDVRRQTERVKFQIAMIPSPAISSATSCASSSGPQRIAILT